MNYANNLTSLIDERIAANATRYSKMGTVTGRDGTGARCLVVFDGSAGVAQPVKCPESVVVAVGDRVGLVKYESDWLITVNYSLSKLADAMNMLIWASSQTTTSATFVDMPNSPSVDFVKTRDSTALRVFVQTSLRAATNAPTTFTIGMHIASLDGTVGYDETVFHRAINVADAHFDYSGWITTSPLVAASYTGTARWLRSTGTGTLTVDTNDSISMHIREVAA
jgi:hypothetical protein